MMIKTTKEIIEGGKRYCYEKDREDLAQEWVSLDEHNELADFTKRLWAELYASDCPKKRFKELTNKLDEFFPSPDKSLNASKRLGTRCGSGLKQSVESPNRRNENNQEINSPQISTGISPKEGRAEVQKGVISIPPTSPSALPYCSINNSQHSCCLEVKRASALPKHYCCKHRFSAHNKDGCTSPLCDCKVPFGGFVKDKRKVKL